MKEEIILKPFLKYSYLHHYPFGSMVENRSWSAGSGYRFEFNGYEQEDEVAGKGCATDFGARIYDTRLGRFFSTDPLERSFAYWAPYQYAGNSPIGIKDIYGLGPGDEVKKDEGALAYAKRNKVSGKDNLSILDNLAKANPNVFKNYPASESYQEKQLYWNDLSGKNWKIHEGQRLEVGGEAYNTQATPTIPDNPKINVDNPVESTIQVYKWYHENEIQLMKEKKFKAPITNFVDFKELNKSEKFERDITQWSDRYSSKTTPQVFIENSKTILDISDLAIFNHSTLTISYNRRTEGDKTIKSARYSGTPTGFILVGFGSQSTENNNRGRNVGILLKFNLSNPKEFEAFRALNKTLGGLPVLYGRGAN